MTLALTEVELRMWILCHFVGVASMTVSPRFRNADDVKKDCSVYFTVLDVPPTATFDVHLMCEFFLIKR